MSLTTTFSVSADNAETNAYTASVNVMPALRRGSAYAKYMIAEFSDGGWLVWATQTVEKNTDPTFPLKAKLCVYPEREEITGRKLVRLSLSPDTSEKACSATFSESVNLGYGEGVVFSVTVELSLDGGGLLVRGENPLAEFLLGLRDANIHAYGFRLGNNTDGLENNYVPEEETLEDAGVVRDFTDGLKFTCPEVYGAADVILIDELVRPVVRFPAWSSIMATGRYNGKLNAHKSVRLSALNYISVGTVTATTGVADYKLLPEYDRVLSRKIPPFSFPVSGTVVAAGDWLLGVGENGATLVKKENSAFVPKRFLPRGESYRLLDNGQAVDYCGGVLTVYGLDGSERSVDLGLEADDYAVIRAADVNGLFIALKHGDEFKLLHLLKSGEIDEVYSASGVYPRLSCDGYTIAAAGGGMESVVVSVVGRRPTSEANLDALVARFGKTPSVLGDGFAVFTVPECCYVCDYIEGVEIPIVAEKVFVGGGVAVGVHNGTATFLRPDYIENVVAPIGLAELKGDPKSFAFTGGVATFVSVGGKTESYTLCAKRAVLYCPYNAENDRVIYDEIYGTGTRKGRSVTVTVGV